MLRFLFLFIGACSPYLIDVHLQLVLPPRKKSACRCAHITKKRRSAGVLLSQDHIPRLGGVSQDLKPLILTSTLGAPECRLGCCSEEESVYVGSATLNPWLLILDPLSKERLGHFLVSGLWRAWQTSQLERSRSLCVIRKIFSV